MRSKLVYSCSIKKIYALRFNKLLGSIFCLLLVVKAFSLQKVVEILEEVVGGWWEVRWIRWMRQNFVAQFIQLVNICCDMQLGVVMEKNWALSVDQCRLQALQFSVHLINLLLSILLRCSWFCWDSESYSRSDGQQTTKQWPWPFSGASLALGNALKLLHGLTFEQVISGCCIKSTFHCMSQSYQEMDHCCVE